MGSSDSKIKKVLKNYQFSFILLSGVVAGALIGFIFGEKASVLQPFADVFLNLVFCLIVPVVFVSIANSIANMGNLKKLGKVLGIFFAVIVIGGLITSLLAVSAVTIFNPAKGVAVEFTEEIDPGNTSLNFVNMFTTSDFVNLLSIKNMMALIIFAILFGIAVASIGKKGDPVVNLFTSLSEALGKMVSIVMLYAPVGIACYFATLIGKMGSQIIGSVARMSIIYAVFCSLFFIAFGIIVPFLSGGREAVRRYWTHIWLPATTAAGACSSTACIPVNLLAAKKMGISDEISSLVIPLGASMHKNGVVSVQIVKIAFLFGVFNMVMGPEDIVKAVIVALLSGIIVGTIPSGGFIGEIFICTAFGFPTSVIPVIVIMGTITDPFCTMNNVTGDTAMAMLITRIVEGKNWIIKKAESIAEHE
ncbi:dicarboxylate/amino acid:cation symporter [Clostridium sp. Marseille-P2415]|uniref:dicarboxylate/amino acid:cation symporter n=1 Tax=Clostridium sp. Marseille-P2415 TaxID=1805471 RepID=UPI0009884FFF|nr:dicarboxylate/amino acid:cation symporter [Clostridium sp. Marseille-P2415]